MKNINTFASSVLLVLCLHSAFAQIFGPQTQFGELNQRRQLSPAQQGHILSDIQQHQHRFNLQQNHPNTPQFLSQQPPTQQTQFANFHPQLPNQQFLQQPFAQNQQLLTNPTIVPSQQTLLSTNQPVTNQQILPTIQTNINPNGNTPDRLLQHHTQTLFTPFKQQQQIPQINGQPQLLQATSATFYNQEQLKTLSPEEQKLRLKEFEDKQAIIQKHNQFVEKQYKKALEKAQDDHSEFAKEQQEEKKKLYEKLYRPTSQQYKYRQNRARYIYPEERDLFDLAIRKYYEEHPTSTTTTTTTSTTSTTTTTTAAPPIISTTGETQDPGDREGRILNRNKDAEIFLSSQSNLYPSKAGFGTQKGTFEPTVLPESSEIKPVTSLENFDKFQDEYKSERITKDDLLAQLKLAIGNNPPVLDDDKNLTSREISLPNGERVEIIRTTDPKLVSGAQPIERGSSLESLIQQKFSLGTSELADSKASGSSLDSLVPENIKLPNGQEVQVIKTSDPSLIPGENPSGVEPSLDELVRAKLNLPDGHKYEIIKTTDPNLIPQSKPSDGSVQDIKLPNGQKVHVIRTTDPALIPSGSPKQGDASLDELVRAKLNLPDGHKYEIIRTTDPKSIPGGVPLESPSSTVATIVKPPTAIFDELTKDVLPVGANFDILRHSSDGLEQISGLPANLPDPKKVTFVLLEEQDDGTLKVQGVKGNNDKDKGEVDVDSILKRIKEGEIKLPPHSPKNVLEVDRESFQGNIELDNSQITTPSPLYPKEITKEFIPSVTVTPNSQPHKEISSTVRFREEYVPSTTPSNTFGQKRSAATTATASNFATKRSSSGGYTQYHTTSADLIKEASTIPQSNQNSIFNNFDIASTLSTKPTTPKYPSSTFTIYKSEALDNLPIDGSDNFDLNLSGILKRNGLFAMAKYLRQSGLDTILNETGPYTLFVPNDKAFRTLLVQLGGPDKAEEKFRENPRLLSGLLLHHVIPGSFKISSLQDEMTGVSLAGTQLRVNQYDMHDAEWNDVKSTTINGAKVLEDKQDITIPQGMAHAVDRVMFPLPVGDIVQTLQSDRERRFTSFLRALFASGLAETFQGIKTFTLFAPTDRAFSALSSEDLSRMVTDKTLARELVLRHILPGTLYTNGMRYYQIKDSLDPNKQITISKSSGKVKINNNPIATQNIPATNGAIHAVDFLL